jgi:hypothetical protein
MEKTKQRCYELKKHYENLKNQKRDSISETETNIIESMITDNRHVIIPMFDDKKRLTSIYTVGIWYLHNFPDIALTFEEPISDYYHFMETFIQMVTQSYRENNNFEIGEQINLNVYGFDLSLKPITSSEIFNFYYMLWFNSYFDENMESDSIDLDKKKNLHEIFPAHRAKLSKENVEKIVDLIIGRIVKSD